ncbi:hypothetical protein QCA50_020571 [Cerrena zonata]|uniref:GST N-terminal domain-containing protein n=1 Tax=Cerrena zonata TaxID=2478898 RepID=A0AAW0FH11_9APHY
MSYGKQFTLRPLQPRRWSQRMVVFVLEELGLTYETIYLDFKSGDLKKPAFTKLNPNGRIPALIDHENNNNFAFLFSFTVPSYNAAVRESDAILLYIVDKYDTEKKLTVANTNEKYQLIQWLFFQASGQGTIIPRKSNPHGTATRARLPVSGVSSNRSSPNKTGLLEGRSPSLIYRSSLGTKVLLAARSKARTSILTNSQQSLFGARSCWLWMRSKRHMWNVLELFRDSKL